MEIKEQWQGKVGKLKRLPQKKTEGKYESKSTQEKEKWKFKKSTHGKGSLEGELLGLRWKTAFGNSEPADIELMREPMQKVLGR